MAAIIRADGDVPAHVDHHHQRGADRERRQRRAGMDHQADREDEKERPDELREVVLHGGLRWRSLGRS